ncbi:MAG TPA: DUF6629 family protein [Verrucomicrobiae bacterium]|jgi:hypothetical protein|nr:DUF6629 family protein [Verrucomicrobiae bacterium]
MCFGPTASFTSGALLTAAGTATLKTTRSKKELLFAAFPLAFAVQQIIEGLLWLGVNDGPLEQWRKPLAALFLFFAYLVWPLISPLGIYLLETQKKNQRILSVFIPIGIATACYMLWFIFHYDHHVTVVHHSIQYHIHKFANFVGFLYLGATYAPYLFSSYKGVRTLGVLNIIFAAISRYMYWVTFDSVWCFFAALLSIGIYFFLRWLHRPAEAVAG